jgi:hypothetical protein
MAIERYEDRLKYYVEYYNNISPSDFHIQESNSKIEISLPQVNEMYSRDEMPQIKKKDLKPAIGKLLNVGLTISKGTISPQKLHPSQKEIYKSKVDKIISKSDPYTIKPIIISSDNYIVDGHHRWVAFLLGFPNHKINFLRLGVGRDKAINIYNKIADLV